MSGASELESFRDELRTWLEANAPRSLRGTREGRFGGYWGGAKHPEPDPDVKRWFEVCLERGFTAPTWPTKYGGAGLSHEQGEVFEAELVRMAMPPPLVGFGLAMIGPTLLDFGTEAQREQHLPAIVRGEVRWCQGYSEPGAGSDLAALSTRAVRDGDAFVVNGQKIWTSFADLCDWIFCLVRTDPDAKKQAGITFLLVDMSTPGVTTRPIVLISGSSPFCEVFLEDVRVPVDQVVGQVNAGWTVAKALLQYERSAIGQAIGTQIEAMESELVALAREHVGGGAEGVLPDPALRDEIARTGMDVAAFKLTIERIQEQMEGGAPGLESSILKICGSELKQRRWALATRILGPQALGWEGPGFLESELKTTREWLRSRGNTIEGGTSEIQLDIIAKRVLGLPGQ